MFSRGERPRDALERVAFAELLCAKSRQAESARIYAEAFAEAFAEDAALATLQEAGLSSRRECP